jgi:gliding motility-associated-like protein
MKHLLLLTLLSAFATKASAQSNTCAGATTITPSFTTCNFQAGSSLNATQSLASCAAGGNADDDVWYQFVANSTVMTISIDPTVGYDPVIQLYSGTCGALTSIQCQDINGVNGDEDLLASGLTIGTTYYFRVYHYGVGSGTSTFNVCVFGLAPPTNNTPCNAYPLPAVTPSCSYLTYTNAGSAGSAVATPSGCGGSSPFQGGYAGGDVWFSVVVPASGKLDIHTQSIGFTDGAMALYGGSCASPSLIECDDDGDPGDGILMPHIYRTGLTPGSTVYIRVWEYNNNNNGQFGICVATPDNDNCANAQQICDLNGYGGVTSSAYTIDQPSNMCGIGNPASPNPGCVFGTGYTGASPVQIDNNSWLKFTASSTTAELFVEISDCANGNGMQMQIFSGTNCTNFAAVSNFLETTTSQTVLATGLTPGQTYYIVVDGFAGDICSYTISATSGVQVVEAIAVDNQLCLGENTLVNAVVTGTGSYTYSWSSVPVGASGTGSSINISPTQSTEYTVEISGLCGTTTTASVYVTVNTPPTANAGSDASICAGQSVSLTATGGGTYSWNNGLGTGASKTVTPSGTTTYTVTVTDANGCTDTDDVTVFVNPLPSANAGSDQTICVGQSATLTATGGVSYSWSNGLGSGASKTVSPTGTTTYTVTATAANGCTNTDQVTVNVNTLPTVNAGNDVTICNGSSISLSASGAATYSWNQGLGAGQSHTVTPAVTTTYTVTGTAANGCVNTDAIIVTVGSALVPDAGSPVSVCAGTGVTLSGSGGINYTWSNAAGTTLGSAQQLSLTPASTQYYYLTVTDGLSCSGEDSVLVTVNPLPTANAGADEVICLGESVSITATGGTTYTWNTGLGAGASHVVSPASTTTYTVTATDGNGCTDADDITVTVNPVPTVLASADATICGGESSTITANGAVSYSWNNSLGAGQSHTVQPDSTTTYVVTGTNSFGCTAQDSLVVNVNPLPVIDTLSMQVEQANCSNGGGTISGVATVGTAPFTYVWNDGLNNVGNTLSIGGLASGTYTLTVTDANGCVSSATVSIGFIDLSTVLAQDDSASLYPGNSVTVNADSNDVGDISTMVVVSGPDNGTGYFDGSGNFVYTPDAGFVGMDSVVYTICDVVCDNACAQATIYLQVDDRLDPWVPTGFSPNGDGYNELFIISNLEQYPDNELFIYNRWGDLVYSAAPYTNNWDGTSGAAGSIRGDKVVDGTYFVVLKYGDGEEEESYQGYVEIRTR